MKGSLFLIPKKKYRPKSKKRIKVLMGKEDVFQQKLNLTRVDFEMAYQEDINRVGNSSGDTFLYQELSYNGIYKTSSDMYKVSNKIITI